MTTTTLYKTGYAIALTLRPDEQAGMVCQDQQSGDSHVLVWRIKQPAPEIVRLDDIVPWTGEGDTNESL